MAATARLSGFRAALEAARIPLRPEYVRRGEFHHSDGLTEGRALLSMPVPPTAIFASSDVQALGVYEAARALGVAIPSELSVVGFDDLKIARWAGPALTTIRSPLLRWRSRPSGRPRPGAGPGTGFSRVEMATTLVVRDSTDVPPQRRNESFVHQI